MDLFSFSHIWMKYYSNKEGSLKLTKHSRKEKVRLFTHLKNLLTPLYLASERNSSHIAIGR